MLARDLRHVFERAFQGEVQEAALALYDAAADIVASMEALPAELDLPDGPDRVLFHVWLDIAHLQNCWDGYPATPEGL